MKLFDEKGIKEIFGEPIPPEEVDNLMQKLGIQRKKNGTIKLSDKDSQQHNDKQDK